MADEYIEREAAISAAFSATSLGNSAFRDVNDTVNRLRLIPSADVAPVRHGRWGKTIGENGVTSACRCNLCGFEDNRYSLFNYCPNCGAKMDGGNDG